MKINTLPLSMSEDTKKDKTVDKAKDTKPVDDENINASNDHDDEFVSELHQASSKDIAEADEAMKKLGLTKVRMETAMKLMLNCIFQE